VTYLVRWNPKKKASERLLRDLCNLKTWKPGGTRPASREREHGLQPLGRPARCSASISPRQGMARNLPLGCTQCQASQSFSGRQRRLAPGCCAISCRMQSTSASVRIRCRYLNALSMPRKLAICVAEPKPDSACRVYGFDSCCCSVLLTAHRQASPGRHRLRRARIPTHQQQLQFVRLQHFRRFYGRRPVTKMPSGPAFLTTPKSLLVIDRNLYGRPPSIGEHEQPATKGVGAQRLFA